MEIAQDAGLSPKLHNARAHGHTSPVGICRVLNATESVTGRQDDFHDGVNPDQNKAGLQKLGAKYVPPALRRDAEARELPTIHERQGSQQAAAHRQIRRLLNRVATANLMGIASEVSSLFGSMPRHTVISTIKQGLMQVSHNHAVLCP